MWQHDGLRPRGRSGTMGARRSGIVLVIRLRKDAVNRINQLEEVGALAVARMRNVNFEVRVNVRGVAAEYDDAVGEDDGLFDIVSHDENRARGNLVTEPELEELAAKSLRGKDVKGGERLVHEEHFGLDDECAGDTDALLHAAGQFLGIGDFKTVEADGVNDAQGTLAAFDGRHAAGLERGLDVFENGEPGEERETLKDDGNIGRFVTDRMAVPVDGAGAGGRKTGQHAKQCGLAAAGRAEKHDDLAGIDGEIGWSDNLDAAAVGLQIEFLQLARFDDGSWCDLCGAHKRVYYRSTAARPHTTGCGAAAHFLSGYNGMNTA